ncbi:19858_t:CDS:10 [Cetraspora pellucida]|uniref:19858_t:CDS:1 n=1 Tax=Cetraspora pellucida TaxID=1433469 RepID=A0A9N9I470_9GLOM|nr:19858_t:CDS:10 [Cetraspora pellucida]
MAKIVEKEEIIDGSIDLIASMGEVTSIHFNYTLQIATIALNNGNNIIKKLNTPPRVLLIYDENHKKSSNKPEQEPNVIDKGIIDESFSQNDDELMPDIQDNNTAKNKQTKDSQINKMFRSSKRIKNKYQNNECIDEQDNEFSDENQQEESISNDPDNNEEMDVSMSVNDISEQVQPLNNEDNQDQNSDIEQEGSNSNDSDSPERSEIESLNKSKRKTRYSMRFQKNGSSYNINNQDSDIERESHNRNEGDSSEKGEIVKTRYSKRLQKKRRLNHENDRNTKKKKPKISSNFGKEKYVKDVDKSFPTVMIEENENDHQIHEIGEGATEINSDRIHEINEDASEIQLEINSERVHEIEDDQEIEAQESSRSNSKDIEADESSISLQSANSIDREDDILNEYIQPSQKKKNNYTNILIKGDPVPIKIHSDMSRIEVFNEILINEWNKFSSSLPTTTNEFEEENEDIKSQIRNVWRKISHNETGYSNSRVKYIHSLCELACILCEVTIKVKKLKKDNQFSVPSLITVFDQETGKEKQAVNPEANPWNRRFAKGEVVASRVYKIMEAEASIIYPKGNSTRISDMMISARRLLILVQRLGWKVIHNSETIDPPRLRKVTNFEWIKLIEKIEKCQPVDSVNSYMLSDLSLKELEEKF